MDRSLTALEVIGLAIRSEEDAARFYGHISKMIENELVRAKYEHLAREEGGHRKLLVEHYREMAGSEERPPRVPGEPETAEGAPVPEEIAHSLEALLNLAVEREQQARAFYLKAAGESTDLRAKTILLYLADVEHGHEMMLKKELASYLRDKGWYVGKDPEMVHVGP